MSIREINWRATNPSEGGGLTGLWGGVGTIRGPWKGESKWWDGCGGDGARGCVTVDLREGGPREGGGMVTCEFAGFRY